MNVLVWNRVAFVSVRIECDVDVIDRMTRQRPKHVTPSLALFEEFLIDHDLGEHDLAVVNAVDRSEREGLGIGPVLAHRCDAWANLNHAGGKSGRPRLRGGSGCAGRSKREQRKE